MLWNVDKKNLVPTIMQLVNENKIDILALVEMEKSHNDYLISELSKIDIRFKKHEVLKIENGISLFGRENVKVSTLKEDNHYSVYKVYLEKELILLFVVHLASAMYKDEEARNNRASSLSRIFEKIEAEVFGETDYKSIVIGDFNLNPFATGIIGAYGFNATLCLTKAKKKLRTVDGDKKLFYYNPMWRLMGKDEVVGGTYFNDSDQTDKSFYWYTFDQVLIRPGILEKFPLEQLKILNMVEGESLLSKHKIDKVKFSDHLPIKFEIREGEC
ncbi:endonuclease/exonuclease/phosphatase family protein [Clostridium sporogenes]|uniref:endonuclease/exonuclease/phosphatase family protein n=1 Tax=Clostridium sporogenes TaxID=1509 RepID=UPI002237B5C7|nr:endonuclease/exonuclease/phosphatase family protein [Clostridium sporogenes]MCW6088166.1 endonuclease/exonuclease/phosphatase family protein [Clostridium sporogenes]